MDSIVLTGMIIKTSDVGESDRRVVILTKERGKITAFARGAKRPKSTLVSATRLFVFGEFTLVEGSKSYSLIKADISRYLNRSGGNVLWKLFSGTCGFSDNGKYGIS